jgi:hypothetical protein
MKTKHMFSNKSRRNRHKEGCGVRHPLSRSGRSVDRSVQDSQPTHTFTVRRTQRESPNLLVQGLLQRVMLRVLVRLGCSVPQGVCCSAAVRVWGRCRCWELVTFLPANFEVDCSCRLAKCWCPVCSYRLGHVFGFCAFQGNVV